MTSPRRLLDEGTPFERDILDSARRDVGPADGFKRTLAAVSFGAAAGTVASVAPSAAAGTTAGATATGASASAGAGILVKWLALAVVLGGTVTVWRPWIAHKPAVAGGAANAMVSSPRPASPPVPLATLPEPEPPPAIASPVSPRVGLEPAPSRRAPESSRVPTSAYVAANAGGTDLTTARASGPGVAAPPLPAEAASPQAAAGNPLGAPEPKARPRPSPVLYGEVAALEGVRSALDHGDSRDALRRLDAYDDAFPRSVLGEEATVLRVDALSQIGDPTAAAALARSFLAANPSSPHAPHLRALTSGMHNP